MKTFLLISLGVSLAVRSFAQAPAPDFGYGPKDSPSVTLGTQQWSARNLKLVTFSNGDKIGEVKTNEEWLKAGDEKRPAWCYYGNDPANGATYGVLYNFYAVVDPRGLAPKGWHIPDKEEWKTLVAFLGSDKPGNQLKSKTLWTPVSDIDRNGNNSTGFNALPAGLRFANDANFDALGVGCHFWTSTENESVNGLGFHLGIAGAIQSGIANKKFGYSVRCIKD